MGLSHHLTDSYAIHTFSSVYRSKDVLPHGIQLLSLQIAINNEISIEQNVKLRLEKLDGLVRHHLQACQNLELYQAQMIQAYSKFVCLRNFRVGELMLVL